MDKTLYDLLPGDKVLWSNKWGTKIYVVERVTTNFVIVNNQKYRKSTGHIVSHDHWITNDIKVLTPELLEQYQQETQHRQLYEQVKRIKMENLTIEQLQAILDIVTNKDRQE